MGQEGQKSVHYVDPKEFYREMCEFFLTHSHLEKGVRPPKIPDCIGKKIMLICERLSYSRQFYESPHREEMVLDAIENCILRIRNFDPAISRNPFAYFTQLAYYSFLNRADSEKKEFLNKVSFVQNNFLHEMFDHASKAGSDYGSDDTYTEFANNLSVYLSYGHKTPEEPKGKPRAKRTTLAYQKKMREKEAAEKLAIDTQIEEALKDTSVLEILDPVKQESIDQQVSHIEDLL